MAQGDWQQQQQNGSQDQDQDEDTVETFTWATGQSHLGIMVMGLTQDLRQFFGAPADRGVLIAKVEPNSPAARAGIQVGDVLVRVGRQRVGSGDDVIQALGAQSGGPTRLWVVRQGRPLRLDATIPRPPSQSSSNPQQQM
jgi:serine protease Do